jgi:hypothetical protein
LLKLEIDVDTCIRQKAVHKGFRGLGIGQQLRVDWPSYTKPPSVFALPRLFAISEATTS